MPRNASNELPPAAARILEPDALGLLAIVLHGCDELQPKAADPPRSPAGWRGRGRGRAGLEQKF